MNAEQRIKRQILIDADLHAKDGVRLEITEDNVDELFDEANEDYKLQDEISEFRCSGGDTGLAAPYSRHYESTAVGKKLDDGTWVGWTYWYGGGKHGEPEAIDWMDEAYEMDVTEKEKVMTVRTFKAKEQS